MTFLSVVERETTAGKRWEVVDALGFSAGPRLFASHTEAWKWIDERTPDGLEDEDRRRRIKLAFSRDDAAA